MNLAVDFESKHVFDWALFVVRDVKCGAGLSSHAEAVATVIQVLDDYPYGSTRMRSSDTALGNH
jgi:hypothetical protein